jgi:capsid assembly protease
MNVLDLLNTPWAIKREILSEMCAIYTAHRNGEARDIKAIEAAIGRPFANEPKNFSVQDGVALIPIEGILSKRMGLFQQICGGTSYTKLQQDVAQALGDPQVSGIILTIDSPGGAIDGVEAAGDAIFSARSQKPIVAYVDGMACSAAYWLASAASSVYVGSDADQVGSIGVIVEHVDTSIAEHQRGVRYTDITAGRYKAVGSQHRPLSSDDRNTIQDQLDHVYGIFVDTVARNRGTDAKTVLSKMADGRVFLGQRAIAAGLVDGKTTFPALIAKLDGRKGTSASATAGRNAGSLSPLPRAESSVPTPAVPAPTNVHAAPALTPVMQKPAEVPPTKEMLIIAKLRVLKTEEIATRRLLDDTVKSKGTAIYAANQAGRQGKSAKEIEPFVASMIRAESTERELRARLRANDQEQLAVLRG